MNPFRRHPVLVLWFAASAWLPTAAGASEAVSTPPPKRAEPGLSGSPAAAAPAAPVDPLERLRRRLSERLATAKADPDSGLNELKVVNKAQAAPSRPGTGSRGSSPAPPAPSARKGVDGAAAWAYEGAAGPQAWGDLKAEFALCAKGQRQSPIELQGGLSVDLEPVRFHYQAGRFAVVDDGRTVQVKVAAGNVIEVGGGRYELQYFTFHRPGEGRIDGREFEMSLHLVHSNEHGRMAVVALLLDPGPPHPVVQQVLNNLPLERHEEVQARARLDPMELMPVDRRYYTYMGSLSMPPCSEGVQWVVMRHPVTVSPEQIELFARLYPMNARPVQAAGGRRIMQSN